MFNMLDLVGMFVGLVGISVCITALILAVKDVKDRKNSLVLKREEPTIKDCAWTRR